MVAQPSPQEAADHPETYTYISAGRNVRINDGALRRGGLSPDDYAGRGGKLPNFRDGTEAMMSFCQRCRIFGPVMHVRPVPVVPLRLWLCAECCPARALPHL